MSSDKRSSASDKKPSMSAPPGGIRLGKGAKRALMKNAECVDDFLHIVQHSPDAESIETALKEEALVLARVTRPLGCGRLQVTLQDGANLSVPIAGTVKFKGRSNNKADRANCMCTDDVIVIRGSAASAKVSPAAAALIRKQYERKGVSTPKGFFTSAVEEEEAEEMGCVGGGGGFEFDRSDELDNEGSEIATLRAEAARAIALRAGKAVAVETDGDSDIDIEGI